MNKINLQAYHAAIKKKTGKTLDEFKQLAEEKAVIIDGRFNQEIKANEIFNWLKIEFNLGRGHGMAIYHSFK